MTEYDHEIDTLIVHEFRKHRKSLTCMRLCDLLREVHLSKLTRTIRYAKVWEHLTRLCEAGILEKSIDPGRNNERYYQLTTAAKLELDFFDSFNPVRSRRQSKTELKEELKDRYERKACFLTLLRAASGTVLPKIVSKHVLGAAATYDQTTQKYEYIKGEKVEGVSHQDIIAHNDMMSLFRHVDFTKSKNYVEILQKDFDLRGALKEVTRLGKHGEIVTGIKVADRHGGLKTFLIFCECMLTWVAFRMSETLKIKILKTLYRKKSDIKSDLSSPPLAFSMFEQKVFRWFIDMEGRESFNQLYNNCKRAIVEKSDIDSDLKIRGDTKTKTKITTVRKLVEKNMRLVEQWDKNIIAYYRGLIECDKIVDFPGSNGGYMYSNEYHNYRDYVRNVMSKRYHDLMDGLLKMVYPEFLQKFHRNDPKLKQFIESLPDAEVLT